MTRRYLSESEILGAIRRGRSVGVFLGAGDAAVPTIRYLTLRGTEQQVTAKLWEVEDPRNPNFFDVSSLYPPNGDDEPEQVFSFTSVQQALSEIDTHFPGASGRFVNQGVIDDEYRDYLAK